MDVGKIIEATTAAGPGAGIGLMTLSLGDLLLSTALPVILIVGLEVWLVVEVRRLRKSIERIG